MHITFLMETTQQIPHNKELEKDLIGTILCYQEAIPIALEKLSPEMFYVDMYSKLYRIMSEIAKAGKPVDVLSVTLELKAKNLLTTLISAYDLSVLTNGSFHHIASNFSHYCDELSSLYIRRQLIKESYNIYASASNLDVPISALLASMQVTVKSAETAIFNDSDRTTEELIDSTFEAMRIASMQRGLLGYSTGLKQLDHFTSGIQIGVLYVIAARPGMGKSALIKTIVVNLAKQKVKVRVFSLEVTAEKFLMNMFSDIIEVENTTIFKGDITKVQEQRIRDEMKHIQNYFEIDDKQAISIQYLERKVRKAVKEGTKVIIIDYLQLMSINKSDVDPKMREQQVAFLSKNLKRIAGEYKVAVIELSQLSRGVDERSDKRPMLSDLRESGSIEQDAEVVMFVFRPEYYKLYKDAQGNDLRGLAEVIIAKNRNGGLGSCPLKFIPQFTKFVDIDEQITNQTTMSLEEQGLENQTGISL